MQSGVNIKYFWLTARSGADWYSYPTDQWQQEVTYPGDPIEDRQSQQAEQYQAQQDAWTESLVELDDIGPHRPGHHVGNDVVTIERRDRKQIEHHQQQVHLGDQQEEGECRLFQE